MKVGMWASVMTLAAPAMGAETKPIIPTDWAQAARADVQAFHDDITANHPGPVNAADPGFSRRSDAALRLALRRAATVRDFPGWLATLRGYAASFDDGHLAFSTLIDVPVSLRWPGFLTAFDDRGRQVVRTRVEGASVPLGAALTGCDGRRADALASDLVGQFRGRWSLAAMRGREGFRVFVDNGNPFVRRPARCTFRIDGAPKTVTLDWQPFPDALWTAHAAPLAQPPRAPIAARTLADGTRWYAISDFDGDPDGAAARALRPMIAGMKSDRAAIATAPRIVLDLRGNGGGSSDWSRQIAVVLWGEGAVAGVKLDSDAVDWRASAANVASLADYRARFAAAPDADPAVTRYFATAAEGIAAARAAGKPLWREPADLYKPDSPAGPVAAVPAPAAPVYVLTDWSCGSACLDAVDLWKALGAVQVGQETSADTLYMDLREDVLPGGRVRAAIPMKVYRGRPRGSNVPQVPAYRFAGDMRDTTALERWVAGLTTRR